jgi:transcriptional regulator with XRE-family HTH domain
VARVGADPSGFPPVEGHLQQVLGHNLRAYREERGLSQEAFAELVGVHRTYMGGIERGERNLTLKSVERLASYLGVSPVELLTSESHKPRTKKPR